eukprot:jgi/Mesvir1/21039/Mv08087-RA.1
MASLLPYLAFLYFIGKKEVKTPALSNFGFRFLLAFVAATIPAGVVAKQQYGTILSNVDWLHGGSESLLTLTNTIIALGFYGALREAEGAEKTSSPLDTAVWAATALGIGGLIATHATGLDVTWANAIAPEPSNALSLPTWAVHVSSVTEWFLAMSYVWRYAAVTGNPAWQGLTWAMLPSFASGATAVTFHLFYNAQPELTPLVATQAGLTLLGNTSLAYGAFRLSQKAGEAQPGSDADTSSGTAASSSWDSDALFVFKLLLWSAAGAAAIKYGEVAVGVPGFPPSLPLGLLIIAGAAGWNANNWRTLSLAAAASGDAGATGNATIPTAATAGSSEEEKMDDKKRLWAQIKRTGVAGTLSYVITEVFFWALALPGAYFGYHQATGNWLSLSEDKAQLVGLAAGFVTGVRLLVPIRMGAAVALIPTVDKYIVQKFMPKTEEELQN